MPSELFLEQIRQQKIYRTRNKETAWGSALGVRSEIGYPEQVNESSKGLTNIKADEFILFTIFQQKT